MLGKASCLGVAEGIILRVVRTTVIRNVEGRSPDVVPTFCLGEVAETQGHVGRCTGSESTQTLQTRYTIMGS